jgi:hypothetical protein
MEEDNGIEVRKTEEEERRRMISVGISHPTLGRVKTQQA